MQQFFSLLSWLFLQLKIFRAFSRPSSGAQWLQWQPLVLPSYRGDSRAVFVVGPKRASQTHTAWYAIKNERLQMSHVTVSVHNIPLRSCFETVVESTTSLNFVRNSWNRFSCCKFGCKFVSYPSSYWHKFQNLHHFRSSLHCCTGTISTYHIVLIYATWQNNLRFVSPCMIVQFQ
jgi:hypothetical protein